MVYITHFFNQLSADYLDGDLFGAGPDSENRCGISALVVYLVSTAVLTFTQQLNCWVISNTVSLCLHPYYPSPTLSSYRYPLVYLNLASVYASLSDCFCLQVFQQYAFYFMFISCIQLG